MSVRCSTRFDYDKSFITLTLGVDFINISHNKLMHFEKIAWKHRYLENIDCLSFVMYLLLVKAGGTSQ